MHIKHLSRKVLPTRVRAFLKRTHTRLLRARVASLPALTENAFKTILTDELGLKKGDSVFVHSSIDRLNLSFPFRQILPIMQEILGEKGTLVFPTYPRLASFEFLSRGEVFDVRRTASYTGILSEIARRASNAFRSLHPTKSVCAIGPNARELASTHTDSVYPFDVCSPYYKIMEYGGKAVGIGVSTDFLSFVHTAEDALRGEFPVPVYCKSLFSARCINYDGIATIVRTYAHDIRTVSTHDTPRFMKRNIPSDICQDLTICGMKFFRADTKRLFSAMVGLAKEGVTIYNRFLPASLLFRGMPKNRDNS